MKKISIKYFAALRETAGKSGEELTTDSETAADLYSELKKQYDFTLCPSNVQVAVNENFEKMNYSIKSGDQIVFIPPVAGG